MALNLLNNTKFNCYDIWQKIDSGFKRPFLAVQTVRNIKKSMPISVNPYLKLVLNYFFMKKNLQLENY